MIDNAKDLSSMSLDHVKLMMSAYKWARCDDPEFEAIRTIWKNRGELIIELLSCTNITLTLGWYNKDKYKAFNDESIIWFQRGLNILEQTRIIHVKSLNRRKVKRVNTEKLLSFKCPEFIESAESIMRQYVLSLIERFKKDKYMENVKLDDIEIRCENMERQPCFAEFHQKNVSFEEYLHEQIDVVVEMYYDHIKKMERLNELICAKKKYTDMFTNYGAYLQHVLKDYNKSLKWLKKGIKYNKMDYLLQYNLGDCYKQMKKRKEAIQHYKLFIKLMETASDQEKQDMMDDMTEAQQYIKRQRE